MVTDGAVAVGARPQRPASGVACGAGSAPAQGAVSACAMEGVSEAKLYAQDGDEPAAAITELIV